MDNYKDEQNDEFEALESIYSESFVCLSKDPCCFSLQVCSEDDDNEQETVGVTLQFTYTKKYPDEKPLFEIVDIDGSFDEEQITSLNDLIDTQLEENLGMVMVFTVMSAVQEFLNDHIDNVKEQIKYEKEKKEREEKEAEQKKCHGTPVTVATFMAWKKSFLEEMAELEKKLFQENKKSKKMTGKQIFLLKKNISDDSEVLLSGEDEPVEVDESLFEDLEDFDLDDSCEEFTES